MAPIEQSSAQPDHPSRRAGSVSPVDVALGASALPLALATAVARRAGSVVRPAVRLAVRPPGVPRRLQPERFLSSLAAQGASRRASLEARLSRELDAGVPWALEEMLRRIRLTDVVLDHVDLDAVVVGVDVEAVLDRVDLTAVVLQRVDLETLVTAVLDRVDLTAVVLQRVDLETLVTAVLDRVDLTAVVLQRVDLETLVTAVLDRVDLTAVVLQRVDLETLVTAVLDRVDLTAVVLQRVDLETLVTAVLDRVDLTAVVLQRVDLDALVNAVIARVDLIGLAEEVIDGVDLPEIIRESTGSMASDAVRGARMQGIAADEAVGRAVDRLLLRRKNRHPAHVLGAQTGHESGLSAPPPQRDGTP